jgi:hypothetical protein
MIHIYLIFAADVGFAAAWTGKKLPAPSNTDTITTNHLPIFQGSKKEEER